MKFLKIILTAVSVIVIGGCAHTPPCKPASVPAEGSPEAIEAKIKVLQQEVDVETKILQREQSMLVRTETNAPDVQNLIAIQKSLERQMKALEDELEATSNIGRPF